MTASDLPAPRPCVVLTYHIIDDPRSAREAPYSCAPATFSAHLRVLAEDGFDVIGVPRLLTCLEGATPWPATPVVVTFDDGFGCAYENALPLLEAAGVPAAIFVISNLVDGDNEWLLAQGFPRRRMLTAPAMRELDARGIEIGSHSQSHPHLGRTDRDSMVREVGGSKARLEDLLSKPIRFFAYPYGSFNQAARHAVEAAGYLAAFSTMPGRNTPKTDRFLLRRVSIANDSPGRFRQKLRFGMTPLTGAKLLTRRVLSSCGLMSPKSYA